MLVNGHHAVSFGLNLDEKKWYFIDANQLNEKKLAGTAIDPENPLEATKWLIDLIIEGLFATEKKRLAMSFKLYANKKDEVNFKLAMEELYDSQVYKKISNITEEKAQFNNEYNHETALCLASLLNNKKTVQKWLEQKADVNHCYGNHKYFFPLYLAVIRKKYGTVNTLLAYGANINQGDKNGFTALHYVSQKGYLEIAKLLLANNPNINQVDANGSTALHVAAEAGHLEIVRAILEKNNVVIDQINKFGVTPFYSAAEKMHLKVMELLLAYGANVNQVNKDGDTALHMAVKISNTDHENKMAMVLIDHANIDVANQIGDTPLSLAVQWVNLPMVKLLIRHAANLETVILGQTIIELATACGSNEILKLLIEHHPNPNATSPSNFSPLIWAIEKGDIEVVTLLINKNAELNKVYPDGKTPLFIAAKNGNLEIVKLLLKKMDDENLTANQSVKMKASSLKSMVKAKSKDAGIEVRQQIFLDKKKCDAEGFFSISPAEIAWIMGYKNINKLLQVMDMDKSNDFQNHSQNHLNDVCIKAIEACKKFCLYTEIDNKEECVEYIADTVDLIESTKKILVFLIASKIINDEMANAIFERINEIYNQLSFVNEDSPRQDFRSCQSRQLIQLEKTVNKLCALSFFKNEKIKPLIKIPVFPTRLTSSQ